MTPKECIADLVNNGLTEADAVLVLALLHDRFHFPGPINALDILEAAAKEKLNRRNGTFMRLVERVDDMMGFQTYQKEPEDAKRT